MGAHPYWYVVPYEDDIEGALQKLRQREFQAGRYNPVVPFPEFPITVSTASPGAQHDSIDDVLAAANEDGTRSILDIAQVSSEPFDGSQMPFFTAFPISDSYLEELFGTSRPTRQVAETNDSMWERIERGSAVYVVLFADDTPREILFAGYSFD